MKKDNTPKLKWRSLSPLGGPQSAKGHQFKPKMEICVATGGPAKFKKNNSKLNHKFVSLPWAPQSAKGQQFKAKMEIVAATAGPTKCKRTATQS